MWKVACAISMSLALVACARGDDRSTASSTHSGTSAASAARMADSAQSFSAAAASSGMFEVRSSELALSRSQDPQVQSFARRMVQDHSRANEELKSIAAARGIELPQRPNDRHRQMLEDLEAAGSDQFDARYAQAQDLAHDEAVALFGTYGQTGEDQRLKEFAQRTLPTLRQHNEMAESLTPQ